MSRKPSKFRKAKRAQRERNKKLVPFNIETHGAFDKVWFDEISPPANWRPLPGAQARFFGEHADAAIKAGTEMHKRLETLLSGHYHVSDAHFGMKYDQLMAYASFAPGADVIVIHGGDLVHPADKSAAPRMGWETIRDPRVSPITGQVTVVINDDEDDA